MALTLSNPGRALASAAMALGLAFVALIFAAIIVIYPMSFTVGLIGLLGLSVLFLMAVILPGHLDAPGGFLRGMLAIVLVVMAVWPGYIGYKYGPIPTITPTRIVYWGLVVLWTFWLVASPRLRSQLFVQIFRYKMLHAVLGVFFFWQLVTAAFSVAPIFSAYYAIKLFLGGYLMYMIVLSVLRDADDVERVITWIVIAAMVVSLFGVAEGIRKANLFVTLLPTDPEQLETLEWIILDKSRSGAYRVAATFSHPLALAEYLTMCLPLAAYLCINGQIIARRLLGTGAIPLLLVALYLSRTRSAVISAAIVGATLIVIAGIRAASQRRNFFKAVAGVFAITGVLLSIAGGIGVLGELTLGRDRAERGSTEARLYMLARGTGLAADEPVTGYGPGLAAVTLGALPGHVSITIDNYYLSVALESGVLGLLLLIVILAYPICLGLYRGLTHHTRSGWLALALASGLLAFAVERGVLSLTNNLDLSLMLIAMLMVVEQRIRSERAEALAGRLRDAKYVA